MDRREIPIGDRVAESREELRSHAGEYNHRRRRQMLAIERIQVSLAGLLAIDEPVLGETAQHVEDSAMRLASDEPGTVRGTASRMHLDLVGHVR
jgi:hypothetical protein